MGLSKKASELDPRIQAIIDGEFADFGKYLPTPQDKKMYERKRKEYWDRAGTRIKEELKDGVRGDDSTGNSGSN